MMRAPDDGTNIGARGARRRRRTGMMWGGVAVLLAAGLIALRAAPIFAVAVAAATAMSALGFMQSRERT